MPKSGKHDERTEQVPQGKRKQTKMEALRPKSDQPDKLYNDLAKFPSENPYPVLRIHRDGTVLYANKAGEPLLKARGSGVDKPAPKEWLRLVEDVLTTGKIAREEVKDNGRVFALRVIPIIENNYVNFYGADITEQKKAEEERELTIELLSLINSNNQMQELMKLVTVLLKDWSGCEAVGIRLQDGEDFPYFVTSGFPEEFVLAENKLCSVNEIGELVRDKNGKPFLECMCGNIISGRFDPTKPFFTEHGSFWTNSTTDLLAGTTETDRLSKTRNRCNTAGYESVALIPLRAVGDTFGLLQFNSKQRGCFIPEKISLLERLADNLAIGLAQRRAEQALRESEEKYRSFVENFDGIAYRGRMDFRPIFFHGIVEKITGYKESEFLAGNLRWDELIHPEDLPGIFNKDEKKLHSVPGYSYNREYRIVRKDGQVRWVHEYIQNLCDASGKPAMVQGTIRDVTDRKRAQEQLLRQGRVLDGINKVLLETLRCETDEDLGRTCLKVVEELTGSKFGFIVEVNKEGRLDTLAISDPGWKACRVPKQEAVRSIRGMEVRGIYGKVIREGRAMIFNEPASDGAWRGIPDGHPAIDCFLGVPLIREGKTTGIIALANKQGGYADEDKEAVEAVAAAIAEALTRKRAESALQQSEERLNAAMNAAELGIWDWDLVSGQITWAGHHARLFGFEEGQFDGRYETFEKMVHPDDLEGFKAAVEKSKKEKSEFSHEFRVVYPDGTVRWLFGKGRCHYDRTGQAVRMLGTVRDITERKMAAEKLQEERNLLRTLIDHIPDKVYVKDRGSRFIACNKSTIVSQGVKREEELIGKTDFDLYEQALAQQFFDKEQELMRTGRPIINCEIPASDGSVRSMLVTKVPLRDSHGNIIGTVGINHDITERKKAEEEMKRLNRVMETITDVNQFIFRIRDRDELLKKVCEAIVKYAYLMVWIGFCDEKNKQITPQAQAGFEEGYLESIKITYNDCEYGMGPSGMAVKTASPNVMQFMATDPRYEPWREEATKRGYRSSAAIPLFGADKVIGVLNVYADKEDAFNQEEVKLLEELSHDISTGLRGIEEYARRRQAEQELLEHQKQLKRLASQLALAEERERRRIAGELHDQVGQSLALAKIKLDALRASATSRPSEEVLADVSETMQRLIDETRLLTFDLSSPFLYELGFEAAVSEWLNEQVRDKHGIATEFFDDGLPKPLGDDIRMLLFRNVREMLINVIKHANADKVRVGIRRIDDSIEVIVEDNGVGFDPAEVGSLSGKRVEFGLFSVRESLEEFGGRFKIESKPGAGCKATMIAPLKRKGIDNERNKATHQGDGN